MTFGILSTESGKLLASFESEDAALAAVQLILSNEPDAAGVVAVIRFDDHGHPDGSLEGEELSAALEGVAA